MKGLKVFCVWVLAITVTVVDGQSRIAFLKTREKRELDAKEWSANSSTIVIPFQFSGTNMLIQAQMGAQNGSFLLDTGSPALIINDPHPKKEIMASGVNAAFGMEDTTVKWFRIDQAEWKNVPAYALDLRHLEASNRQPILGLLGYGILKKHELLIAPKEQLLYLLPNDESNQGEVNPLLAKVPLVLEDHLPIIEIELAGRILRFGLDTGAESNLIDPSNVEKFAPDFSRLKGQNNVRGLDKKTRTCPIINVQEMSIGDVAFNDVDFTVMDLSHIFESSGIQLDGIIGSAFLTQMKCAINYRKRIFKILERY